MQNSIAVITFSVFDRNYPFCVNSVQKIKIVRLRCNLIPTIIFIIFWDFLMFYQIFLSRQVKRRVIISNKHGTCELPRELPNDLRLRILRNYEISEKFQKFIELVPSFASKIKILLILANSSWKSGVKLSA